MMTYSSMHVTEKKQYRDEKRAMRCFVSLTKANITAQWTSDCPSLPTRKKVAELMWMQTT